jgi:hypothetical protein
MAKDIFESLGLDKNPFSMAADTEGYFHTDATKQILDELAFGILSRKGFLLLTGEVGVGKTSLLYQLLKRLEDERLVTSWIFNTMLNKEELLLAIARDFSLDRPRPPTWPVGGDPPGLPGGAEHPEQQLRHHRDEATTSTSRPWRPCACFQTGGRGRSCCRSSWWASPNSRPRWTAQAPPVAHPHHHLPELGPLHPGGDRAYVKFQALQRSPSSAGPQPAKAVYQPPWQHPYDQPDHGADPLAAVASRRDLSMRSVRARWRRSPPPVEWPTDQRPAPAVQFWAAAWRPPWSLARSWPRCTPRHAGERFPGPESGGRAMPRRPYPDPAGHPSGPGRRGSRSGRRCFTSRVRNPGRAWGQGPLRRKRTRECLDIRC